MDENNSQVAADRSRTGSRSKSYTNSVIINVAYIIRHANRSRRFVKMLPGDVWTGADNHPDNG